MNTVEARDRIKEALTPETVIEIATEILEAINPRSGLPYEARMQIGDLALDARGHATAAEEWEGTDYAPHYLERSRADARDALRALDQALRDQSSWNQRKEEETR